MRKMRKAVSLLLAAALVLTTIVGSNGAQAAKKTSAKVSSVKITNTGKTMRLQKGKTFKLKTSVKVKPNKSKNKKVKFTSSNRKVVLVNSRGKMKGVKVGTAKITAASRINPKKKAVISVSVTKDVLVSSIKLNRTKITAEEYSEEEIPLKVTKILPANAKNKEVVWSTDNEEVADVDDDGVVTTGEVGTATITATAEDKGGAYATCKVVVTENKSQGSGNSVETEQPPVQEQPGEIAPPADVPTQEPGQSEESPSPEGPEETEPSEPGDVTAEPTKAPTLKPTEAPTLEPTEAPTPELTEEPTEAPTLKPTEAPTPEPTKAPTLKPTVAPTPEPVLQKLNNPQISDDDITTWDCVYFGNYWQNDTNGDGVADQSDRKEPIKWRVLSVDGDDVFLLADESLDCQPYNEEFTDVTWGTCTLRSWLNDSFFTEAFTAAEQSAVRKTVVANQTINEDFANEGEDTEDYVYLLSKEEVGNDAYGFPTGCFNLSPAREAKNTAYTIARGARTSTIERYAGNSSWWLRAPGIAQDRGCFVQYPGCAIDGAFNDARYIAVRPVLHLDLSAGSNWSYAGTVTAKLAVPFVVPDASATPDPYVPEGDGWRKLDLSGWSGAEDHYSEEGDRIYLSDTWLETLPIPDDLVLDKVGDKLEVMVCGSISAESGGFRFWLANEEDQTLSQQYYYTEESVGIGADSGNTDRFNLGQSFRIRTVLEHTNHDGADDILATKLLLKAPSFDDLIEGVTITGIWIRNSDAIPTPDPYVPKGDGWKKLDLSGWSGAAYDYSEEGDQIILGDTELGTLPLPTSLENVRDKVEVLIRGSVSEDSDGFRFWLANEDQATRSGLYFYTSVDGEKYWYGESADDHEERQIGDYKPGESFHIQTVFENVNWDNETDTAATSMLLKGPIYFEPEMSLGNMKGVTITGIWVRYGDEIGTTVEDPMQTPKPAWTPDPDKKVENVTLTYDYEFPGPRMVRFDGTVVNHEDEENANVEGYPADGIDVRYYDKVIVKYEGSKLTGNDNNDDWLGKATLNSTDEGLGQSEFSDGLFTKWFNDVDTKVKYQDGVYTVEYDIDEDHLNIEFDPEEVGLIDCISVQLANEEDYAGFKLKSIEFISNDNIYIDEYELDLQKELWTNDWCEKVSNPDGSVTLTIEKGKEDWAKGEFGFAVPRDVVGNQHKLTKIIIKYRDSDLTGTEIDETTDTCGYLFHLGDTDQVEWIDGEGLGTDPDFPESHQYSLLFNGTGETVITAGENEKNFSTMRIFDGKIGGKITIESIRLVKEGLSGVETPKPTPTPDPWTPSEDAGWVKLDLSQWSGGEGNYLETGDQIILNDTGLETLPLPTSLENLGDKVEVLIRGSVSEDSDGFRFWLANEYQDTMSGQYFYTSENGEMYRYGESSGDPQEKQIGEYKPGEAFHIQTVFENVNWDNATDMAATSMLLKGPIYFEPEMHIENIKGVTITGIWVRYGDKIGTTEEDPTIKAPVVDTPTVEIS